MIEILNIAGAHGIRGAVRVVLYSEKIESYKFLYDAEGRARKFRVVKYYKNRKYCVIALEGINDRNAAEKLVGTSLFIKEEDLPPLPSDELYIYDLIEKVITIENSDEKCKIISVQNFGATDLIEIEYQKNNFYVPFTKENFPMTADGEISISADAIRMYK